MRLGRSLLCSIVAGVCVWAQEPSPRPINALFQQDSAIGSRVAVIGVLTSQPVVTGRGSCLAYLQDSSGAIVLYTDVFAGLALQHAGDLLKVTGKLALYQGGREVLVERTEYLGNTTIPPVRDALVADLHSDRYFAKRVRVAGELSVDRDFMTSGAVLKDRSGTMRVFMRENLISDQKFLERFLKGGPVELVAYLRKYAPNGKSTPEYDLVPQNVSDIRLPSLPPYRSIALIAAIAGIALFSLTLWIRQRQSERRASQLELLATRLRASEEALRASESLYRSVTETALEAIFRLDETGRVIFSNKAAESLFGYACEEMAGTQFFDLLPERMRNRAREVFAGFLETGELPMSASGFELIGQHRDGGETPMDGSVTGHVENGRQCVTVVIRDARIRKKAEEATAHLATLVESSGDAILSTNRDGVIQTWNPGAAHMFGYGAAEVIGKAIAVLFSEDHKGDALRLIERAVEGESMRVFETVARRQDGCDIDMAVTVSPLRDAGGRILGIVAIARDITAQLTAKRELSESAERFRLLFEEAPIAYHEIDCEGFITRVNRADCELLGRNADEIIGHAAWEFVKESQREQCKKNIRAMLAGDLPVSFVTREWVRKGDETFIGEVHANVILDSEGRVAGIRTALFDVTERTRTQLQLATYSDELRHKNEELEAALAIAREAVELKGQFVANVSHEIRTPMNGVIGMTSLLLETELTFEQRDYAETVLNSAQALLVIINDILDFSKIAEGRVELEKTAFAPYRLVEDILKLFLPQASAKSLRLTYRLEPALSQTVFSDPGRLRQILINLVGNAVKFTEAGSVNVSAEIAEDGGPYLKLLFRVTDSGIGIPIEAQRRLFQPFVQADGSITRKYGGSGLGLAISKKLAETMGGEMGVESTPGHGSTFWFTVQVEKANDCASQGEPAIAEYVETVPH